MTWVAWRQTRSAAVTLAVAATTLGTYLVLAGLHARGIFRTHGIAGCLGIQATQNMRCVSAISDFTGLTSNARGAGGGALLLYLNLVPALLGAFLGAPLLTREFEHRTHRLAWTQSVTRTRWLTTRLLVTGAVAVVAELALSAAITFARAPVDRINGHFTPDSFNLEGVTPSGQAVLAFILGVTAGAALRRTLPAMAVTLTVFTILKTSIQAWLRPHYLPPRTVSFTGPPPATPDASHGDWILTFGFQTIHTTITYQPGGRFWTFQLIELAIYLSLATALLALLVPLIRRRV